MALKAKQQISVRLGFDSIRIYFGEALHVWIKKSSLRGIQSWRYGDKNYFIEFNCEGAVTTCEYDDVEKFTFILKELDGLL